MAGGATMRVRQETLDGLIALEGEVRAASLSLSEALRESAPRAAIARLGILASRVPGEAGREVATLAERLRRFEDALEAAESRLSIALRRLDEAVMELRVLPVGTLLSRMPERRGQWPRPAVRRWTWCWRGRDVALDRSLVEALADPLLHLVRNAVDHGGRDAGGARGGGQAAPRPWCGFPPRAVPAGCGCGSSDDGRGIHRDRCWPAAVSRGLVPEGARLTEPEVHACCFRPGFSTHGHGDRDLRPGGWAGMSCRTRWSAAGGTLEVASVPGAGTSFTLRLPLSAATQEVHAGRGVGPTLRDPALRVERVGEGAGGRAVLRSRPRWGLPRGPGGATVSVRGRGGSITLGVDRIGRRAELLFGRCTPRWRGCRASGEWESWEMGRPCSFLIQKAWRRCNRATRRFRNIS
jgi:two-component system chemotaxis sensor kinase CheA